MRNRIAGIGFQHPVRNIRRLMARRVAFTELLMTVVLVVCLAVALTAVSFGMARADTLGAIVDGRDGALAVTTFFALLVAGMGGITAVVTRRERRRD
ncbi:MAG: hypothetical protein RO009_12800 [Pseudorhodoplanes sp.]|jgi:hypothetical protein|nr:hypothetical protein [Pseudorhodoplanes sp.]